MVSIDWWLWLVCGVCGKMVDRFGGALLMEKIYCGRGGVFIIERRILFVLQGLCPSFCSFLEARKRGRCSFHQGCFMHYDQFEKLQR